MAPRASVTVPTTLAFSNSYRIISTDPFVQKTLGKLSKTSLLTLVGEWLTPSALIFSAPDLQGNDPDDEDGGFTPAQSLDELKDVYAAFENGKGGKREVLDRVLEGDWRHGISLRQLATADVQYLLDHPTSQKWTALKLDRITSETALDSSDGVDTTPAEYGHLPRFHAPTFLQNLQAEVGPLARAHYHLTKMASLPITLFRIQMYGSPYSDQGSLGKTQATSVIDVPTTLYVAFPHNTPFLYVSVPAVSGQSKMGNSKTFRKVVIDALPKAFSRPRNRYALKPTSLSARSLNALVSMRGSGRGSTHGGWSVFAEGSVEESPLVATCSNFGTWKHLTGDKENMLPLIESHGIKPQDMRNSRIVYPAEEPSPKRRKMISNGRFGHSNVSEDDCGVERLEIRIEDSFTLNSGKESPESATDEYEATALSERRPSRRGRRPIIPLAVESDHTDEDGQDDHSRRWTPKIHLTFHGSHVFAGIRKLVESGAVVGDKMPGWMSGEDGVNIGVVRDRKIRGCKGSGLS
ncbi:hypothetical protein MMC14_001934 [Varicellaria rhodocarpa]|nr:hypothetical protein [Varicellaria rhodocarpa]